MTPREFKLELGAIAKEIGPEARLTAHISERDFADHTIYCGVYPRGVSHNVHNGDEQSYFSIEGETFEEITTKVRAKWAEFAAEFRAQTLRKMALAIIRITAANGHCTDAALRQEYTDAELKRYGADACVEANTIAGKGPFEIVTIGGANGAPDIVERPEGATVN